MEIAFAVINSNGNSIKDAIKRDVLQEVQRVLLEYETRIAQLEQENFKLKELINAQSTDVELQLESLFDDLETVKLKVRELAIQ